MPTILGPLGLYGRHRGLRRSNDLIAPAERSLSRIEVHSGTSDFAAQGGVLAHRVLEAEPPQRIDPDVVVQRLHDLGRQRCGDARNRGGRSDAGTVVHRGAVDVSRRPLPNLSVEAVDVRLQGEGAGGFAGERSTACRAASTIGCASVYL